MSKTDKLLKKLQNSTISAAEARTLLKKLGWALRNTEGSHEQWVRNEKRITIASHGKELKPYIMNQIKKALED
jgi:predicted RNA binding protein YcfA (HicA-like mRNA interferase family)